MPISKIEKFLRTKQMLIFSSSADIVNLYYNQISITKFENSSDAIVFLRYVKEEIDYVLSEINTQKLQNKATN